MSSFEIFGDPDQIDKKSLKYIVFKVASYIKSWWNRNSIRKLQEDYNKVVLELSPRYYQKSYPLSQSKALLEYLKTRQKPITSDSNTLQQRTESVALTCNQEPLQEIDRVSVVSLTGESSSLGRNYHSCKGDLSASFQSNLSNVSENPLSGCLYCDCNSCDGDDDDVSTALIFEEEEEESIVPVEAEPLNNEEPSHLPDVTEEVQLVANDVLEALSEQKARLTFSEVQGKKKYDNLEELLKDLLTNHQEVPIMAHLVQALLAEKETSHSKEAIEAQLLKINEHIDIKGDLKSYPLLKQLCEISQDRDLFSLVLSKISNTCDLLAPASLPFCATVSAFMEAKKQSPLPILVEMGSKRFLCMKRLMDEITDINWNLTLKELPPVLRLHADLMDMSYLRDRSLCQKSICDLNRTIKDLMGLVSNLPLNSKYIDLPAGIQMLLDLRIEGPNPYIFGMLLNGFADGKIGAWTWNQKSNTGIIKNQKKIEAKGKISVPVLGDYQATFIFPSSLELKFDLGNRRLEFVKDKLCIEVERTSWLGKSYTEKALSVNSFKANQESNVQVDSIIELSGMIGTMAQGAKSLLDPPLSYRTIMWVLRKNLKWDE